MTLHIRSAASSTRAIAATSRPSPPAITSRPTAFIENVASYRAMNHIRTYSGRSSQFSCCRNGLALELRDMISKSKFANAFVFFPIVLAMWLSVTTARAQTTSFVYQGRLSDGGVAANGNYDLQFALFDSLSGGAQVGSTQTLNTIAVSNGVFTVSLDFGANAFNGANRFLEISARPSGAGSTTLLTPRQQITSTPYAVRSLNATTADSVPASGVPAGSGNYIQNSAGQQASSNFNISGNGTAGGTLSGNVVNATTQYNLNGSRILSNAGNFNSFVGVGAGESNTGGQNSFFGAGAGRANTTAAFNSFFGHISGTN